MKQAMKKWLERHQITFDPNTASSICNRFGLDGEKADECLGLCYQLESGNIDNGEFTGGLCVLTGREPEEVMGILRSVEGTRPKMTQDELDKKAVALFIKRHGREAYESGEIGETLERIEQRAEEYDPVFLSKHPELKGKSITVYHDPLAGEDWAVVNNETGEVVEIFSEEVMGILKGVTPEGEYVRVTIKEEGKRQQSFWAIKGAETRFGNIYTPVDKEGKDLSKTTKEGYVLPKELISKGLIVKEEPAHIDRTYGIMKVGKLPPPPIEVAIPKAEGDLK